MDADDPEKYCNKLREIDAQQVELKKIIQTLKAELTGMQEELYDAALPEADNYSYNPPDAGMQVELYYEPSSFIGELDEDLNSPEVDCYPVSFVVMGKETLPDEITLLNEASVGKIDMVENNDPIESIDIPKFNLLLKSISREIRELPFV